MSGLNIFRTILLALTIFGISAIGDFGRAAEPRALARLSGPEKERVAQLIAGAKKEGELVAYSGSWRPDVQAKMIPLFREEYGISEADLKFKIISTRTGAIVTKITEELRAKVYKTDVINNGTVGWFNDLIEKKELMAYDCPEYKSFSPLVADPKIAAAHPPYFIATKVTPYGIAYNPKHVKGEFAHWKDVLRPEYKGKICAADVSKSFSYTDGYLALRRVTGKKFFEDLGKLKPFVMVSASDLVNKCVSGEYPIVVMASENVVFRTNEKGAGLRIVLPPEGWIGVGFPTVILARAPHPNASKLFMDFIHGKACQDLFLNFAGDVVGRLGLKSKYEGFPQPIYNLKGMIEMDWRKVTDNERNEAREEFRKLAIGE